METHHLVSRTFAFFGDGKGIKRHGIVLFLTSLEAVLILEKKEKRKRWIEWEEKSERRAITSIKDLDLRDTFFVSKGLKPPLALSIRTQSLHLPHVADSFFSPALEIVTHEWCQNTQSSCIQLRLPTRIEFNQLRLAQSFEYKKKFRELAPRRRN